MDSDEAAVIEDYESSLEDLTFNSKPLINVLTMLAEENREHAIVIVKLIQRRINKVEQLQKLPALYLLDSIIKNVGGEYLNLIAQVIDSVFTTVFEKADEKTRRDLHKLRNTWPQYFSAKKLYELDVKVKNLDPAWPISSLPPPSPTIHINPKFLKKVEEVGPPKPAEDAVRQDHQTRLLQLQKLQEEQLKLTEREIEEHKLKHELLLKKQMHERQMLIKQQQEQMLKLRLLAEQKGTSSDSDTENSSVPSPMDVSEVPSDSSFSVPQSVIAVNKEINNAQQSSVIRDPRLRKNGQQMVIDKGKGSDDETRNTRLQVASDTHRQSPVQIDNRVPQAEKAKELIEPKFESEHLKLKPGDERGLQLDYKHGRHGSQKGPRNSDVDRRAITNQNIERRDSRSKDVNRRKRDERKRGRGRGFNRGGREQQDETWKDRNTRRGERRDIQDKKDTDFPINDHSRLIPEEPLMKKPKPLFDDHEILEIRGHGAASPRKDLPMLKDHPENPELNLVKRDHFESIDRGHPPHHIGRHSPPPPVSLGIRPGHRKDVPPHIREPLQHEDHWHGNPDQQQSRPTFEIPQELTLDHKSEILTQAERRLSTGDISKEQHQDLVEKLEQFYELQRQQEQFQRMNFERQLGPERHPDEYVRPQEVLRHGEPRMAVPHNNMRLGEPGAIEVPTSLPLRSGLPVNRDEAFHPIDPSRPFPTNEHQGPFRPFNDHHPNFTVDQQRPSGPMGRHGLGEFRGQGSDIPMDLDDIGHIRPFEGPHEHLDHPDRIRNIDNQGRNPDFSRRINQPRHHIDQQHFHPLDHERTFRPEMDHMRHGFPEEARQREPLSHGWPSNRPEHWQGEPGRLLGPLHDRGRNSPCMDMDVPRGEFLRNPDMAEPGFRADMRGGPPIDQRGHQETIPSSMGQIRTSQFEPRPAEHHLTSREESRINVVMPQTPPRDQSMPNTGTPFTPNKMLEKKSVDDLFQRLVSVGIIKVMPEQIQEPPTRSATPPQLPLPAPQSKPDEKIPEIKTEKEMKIPEIKLIPSELKKRHISIINRLCSGTQCSSCGLRFPGEVAVKYREHLDWHFRMNRREKDGRRVAHRQWYITFKDWLSYEEISDPEERAHSSVFEVLKGSVTSDSLVTTSATENNSNSTPVLDGDKEAESTCDICCEKFEQFWEESAEEWHYRNAVRVDGKTYHNLCYQDAKESHTEADEEEKDGDCKDASDNIPTSSDEKPLNKNTADEKGEKGTLKHESGSSKDTVEKNSEKCSSEECKTLEKELEVDSKASGKVLANKDAKGQSNEI